MSERMKMNRLNNTRDLGGMITADGRRIRPGKLIRSGHLYYADEADCALLADTVSVIVDFRTARETAEKPDPVFPGVKYHALPVLTESSAGITREEGTDRNSMVSLMREPESAKAHMCRMYRTIGSSPECAARYETFVRILLENREKAVLWHCTAGKDRAGFASVIIEELLGVSRADIYEDYLMTNVFLREEVDALMGELKQMAGAGDAVSEESMRILFSADREYLDALYDAIEETCGGMETYLRDVLHVSDADRAILKERYLQ